MKRDNRKAVINPAWVSLGPEADITFLSPFGQMITVGPPPNDGAERWKLTKKGTFKKIKP
jgi:hypothetical protein